MGAAPFGAFVTGALAEAYGPQVAIAVPAAAMLAVVAAALSTTRVWRYSASPASEA